MGQILWSRWTLIWKPTPVTHFIALSSFSGLITQGPPQQGYPNSSLTWPWPQLAVTDGNGSDKLILGVR